MWVAAQMGHSDWTMIAKVIGRWMPAADVEASAKAEAKFYIPEKLKKTGCINRVKNRVILNPKQPKSGPNFDTLVLQITDFTRDSGGVGGN